MPKLRKPQRHRHQVPLLLSTDVAGVFALHPHLFYQLYQTLTADCCPIDGVEFLPFRFSHHRVQPALDKFNIPIVGIHGPVAMTASHRGLLETIYVTPFATVTPSVNATLKLANKTKPNYLLFHEPDLDKCCFTRQFADYLKQEDTPTILIENVYRPNSLQISINKARRLSNQTRAGVMIDLVHLLHEVMGLHSLLTNHHRRLNTTNIDEYWLKMLLAMDKALNQISIAGIHLPIGSSHDSLPWKTITPKHWRQLAKLLDKHQDRLIALTLENQHLETAFSMKKKHLPHLIKDKKTKIKTLIQAGVL